MHLDPAAIDRQFQAGGVFLSAALIQIKTIDPHQTKRETASLREDNRGGGAMSRDTLYLVISLVWLAVLAAAFLYLLLVY